MEKIISVSPDQRCVWEKRAVRIWEEIIKRKGPTAKQKRLGTRGIRKIAQECVQYIIFNPWELKKVIDNQPKCNVYNLSYQIKLSSERNISVEFTGADIKDIFPTIDHLFEILLPIDVKRIVFKALERELMKTAIACNCQKFIPIKDLPGIKSKPSTKCIKPRNDGSDGIFIVGKLFRFYWGEAILAIPRVYYNDEIGKFLIYIKIDPSIVSRWESLEQAKMKNY